MRKFVMKKTCDNLPKSTLKKMQSTVNIGSNIYSS